MAKTNKQLLDTIKPAKEPPLFDFFDQSFFARPTLVVAREILGARLVRQLEDGSILSGEIVELEAYTGDDPACHAARGKTPRCEVMFGPPGVAYVYFIYGMYHCLNIVTEPDGIAGAILIRAVAAENANGPGKLCKYWQIDKSHNGNNLLSSEAGLWLSRSRPVADEQVGISPRIGISCGQDRLWRFFIKDHPAVSKGKPSSFSDNKPKRKQGR